MDSKNSFTFPFLWTRKFSKNVNCRFYGLNVNFHLVNKKKAGKIQPINLLFRTIITTYLTLNF